MSSNGISSVNVGVGLGGTTSVLAWIRLLPGVRGPSSLSNSVEEFIVCSRGTNTSQGSAGNGGGKVRPPGGPKSGGRTADSKDSKTNSK
ncbi:hypothetical protein ARMGADRAFT_1080035 [Armillaria gallica]|uniref:Uncharacterized protein n=1 Tax=Armillaria gallica TaxID=47427 RepID=A0A2H3DZD6_ARMGA|nr:hypothetical protein ARMGADRAFT_1080035 [Armillaria gallica]